MAAKKPRSSTNKSKQPKPATHKRSHTNTTPPRVRKLPAHRSFHLSKKIRLARKPVPGAYSLVKQSFRLFFSHKKLFFGIILVNALLVFALVQSFGTSNNISTIKAQVEELLGEDANRFSTTLAIFSFAFSSLGAHTSEISGVYQLFLTLLTSLAIIWAVRQIMAGGQVTTKDAFYKGMYPLVPFMVVMLIISLQLIPILLGNLLYGIVFGNGLAVTPPEKVIWALIYGLLVLLSLYMVLSSLFALYIVTLPDMTPLHALRSARELVLHRRLGIGLRIVALPIVVVCLAAVIMIPLIFFVSWAAQVAFTVLSAFGLVFVHVYLYNLYRSLL